MSTTLALVLLGIGCAVIAGMGGYAWSLRNEVRRREAFRQDEERRARENGLENLGLVASALVQRQVDVTEGCWRLKVLFELIDPALLERREFRVVAEVYEQTRHLHTHQARQALTPKERFAEDKQRLAVEEANREDVLAAAQAALDFQARYPDSLN
ncbi:DUF2489 domain-containing protein [Halomonas denitrificans]|uniref:DUF2489 domain-containing protein n=1 Tax=Halomonas denitrificans TaxID=370769 RepID=UPI001C992BD6|nr:DUF2489 domain-containing protein [Halomonas denitrificans]MBY5969597.1 DUF2489 domain-containing protein [Halomonas denitrificans]